MWCCAVVELIMFVMGVIGVAKGKVSFTRNRVAIGTPARIAGALLLIPLPVYIVANIIAGVAIFGGGGGQQTNTAPPMTAFIAMVLSVAVTAACFLAAIIICAVTAKPFSKRKAAAMAIDDKDLDYFKKGDLREPRDLSAPRTDPDERIEE